MPPLLPALTAEGSHARGRGDATGVGCAMPRVWPGSSHGCGLVNATGVARVKPRAWLPPWMAPRQRHGQLRRVL